MMQKKHKKGQAALEFVIIFFFVLVIITIIMYLGGNYMVDLQKKEVKNQANTFVENINKELKLLRKVEPGYTRELVLPINNYNITLHSSMIIINDTLEKEEYYFELIGSYQINKSWRIDENGLNRTILTFKNNQEEYSNNEVFLK